MVLLSTRVEPDLRKAVHKAAITVGCTMAEYVTRLLNSDSGVQRELAELGKQKRRAKEK